MLEIGRSVDSNMTRNSSVRSAAGFAVRRCLLSGCWCLDRPDRRVVLIGGEFHDFGILDRDLGVRSSVLQRHRAASFFFDSRRVLLATRAGIPDLVIRRTPHHHETE